MAGALGRGERHRHLFFGRINRKIFLASLLIALIPMALGAYFSYRTHADSLIDLVLAEQEADIEREALILVNFIQPTAEPILFVSRLSSFERFIESGDPASKADVERDFLAFLRARTDYSQIRYIDEHGREVVRAESNGAGPRIVPEDELQDKSDRPYVNEIMALGPGEVYISLADLNMERGALENRGTAEEPVYVPTLRHATPVFDSQGRRRGLVITNVRLAPLLDRLRESATQGREWLLVDLEGNYLVNPDRGKEFGASLGTDESFSKDYPDVAAELLAPKNRIPVIKRGSTLIAGRTIHLRAGEDRPAWILLDIHTDARAALYPSVKALGRALLAAVALAALVVLAATFAASRSILEPLHRLYEAAEEIEKGNFKARVDIRTGDELQQLGDALNDAAEALNRLDEEREQLNTAKMRFLSITSHELRSPMTPIKAQLQMLLKGYHGKLNAKQREAMEMVLRNADNLDKILADFLELSRIEAAHLKFIFVKTSVGDVIREIAEEMKAFMPEKKVWLTMEIGKLPSIEADPMRLKQVLRNLVGNAVKFSPEGSAVRIRAEARDSDILVSVRDNGIGISADDQRRMFEPFFQAEQTIFRKHGGAGLGLAICKGIVESQDGTIGVESEPGKGSTFSFTIPLEPVREPKPIQLLFSSQVYREKALHDIFIEHFGPLGEREFSVLKERGLKVEAVMEFLHMLEGQGVLDSEAYWKVTDEVGAAFGITKQRRG